MQFKVGDIVSLLHQTGKYTILAINHTQITIEDEHGFDQKIDVKHLVPQRPITVSEVLIFDKDSSPNSKVFPLKTKNEYFEIDLHIEALISKDAGLSAHDKFMLQIKSFHAFTNLMIDKRQKKFRIIHGAGEGKLKNEIRSMLSVRNGFTMHYDQYSFGRVGASIIEIKLSVAAKF